MQRNMIYLKLDHLYNGKRSVWFGGELRLPGQFCRDLEMEIVVITEWFSARSSIRTEVGIEKKGSCLSSVHYMETYLMVAPFCSLENKMGIPNTLLVLLTIASRLSRICHALQHFLWPFRSQSKFPQNISFAVVQPSHLWTAYLLLQAFIYPRQTASKPSLFSHNPFLVNSQLVHHSHFQPMENMTFSSSFQDMQNQEISSVVYAQNDQQTDNIPSTSFMPLTHLQPTSYYPQLHNQTLDPQLHNQTLEFPYALSPEHQAQLAFPAWSYQSNESEMRTAALNLSPSCLLSGLLSNALASDVPEGACSMQTLGISDVEGQRKIYLSTCKAARARRMKERQIRAGIHMKPSGGHSSCSSSISKNGSNGYLVGFNTFGPPDGKELKLLLQKKLTSSDVGSNGRIILPKKNAERSLPNLSSREGIMVAIRDVHSNYGWRMRYGFWENHKGRMYILDQCGDFVNQNRLASGDILTLYEDERKELYFSIQKTKKPMPTPTPTPSNDQSYLYYTYTKTPFSVEAMEEESSSLQILMEELKHTEQLDANNLMNL